MTAHLTLHSASHLAGHLVAVMVVPAMPGAVPRTVGGAAPSALAAVGSGGGSGLAAGSGVLGALAGLGLVLAVDGARSRPRRDRQRSRESRDGAARGRGLGPRPANRASAYSVPFRRRRTTAAGVAGVAGVAAGVVTRWPVAGLLVAGAVWWLLFLYRYGRPGDGPGGSRAGRSAIARIEAIATWAEELRDVLSAATGLEQALLTTAPLVPDAIAAPIARMATRIRAGERLPDALRVVGDELADPTADLVIAALITAASRQGGDLAGLLGELAATAREHAAMRLRVRAEQARIRSAAQIITGATTVMAAGLMLGSPHFLNPYDSVAGQLVLAAIGIVFAAGFAWLYRLAQIREPGRILGGSDLVTGRVAGTRTAPRGETAS